MVGNHQDRRVRRTRRLFRTALLKLLQENEYSSISIENLADQADLGRTTFYLHYKDKDALLDECLESVVWEFTEKLHSFPTNYWKSNDPRILQMLFEFVSKNETFIKIMLHDPSGLIFFQRLQNITVDFLTQIMKDERFSFNTQLVIPLEILCSFTAGAILATIEWWVANDRPYSNAQMVEFVSNTMKKSVWQPSEW